MKPADFIDLLVSLTFENTFNPYLHHCAVHDLEDAPALRRQALLAILDVAANLEVDAIWIGRDLGYRGGRRTGLALTDDIHVQSHATRWGVKIKRSTKGQAVAERTAAVIWDILNQVDTPIFLWNVFPLHPHEATDPFTNRSHSPAERRAGEDVLAALIELLRPKRLIAIGNDAAKTAARLSPDGRAEVVRHPSYGGQTEFLVSMRELYGLQGDERQLSLL